MKHWLNVFVSTLHTPPFFSSSKSSEVPSPGNSTSDSALPPEGQSGDKWQYLHHELTSRPNPPVPQLVEPQVCVRLCLGNPEKARVETLCVLRDVLVHSQNLNSLRASSLGPALPACPCNAPFSGSRAHYNAHLLLCL